MKRRGRELEEPRAGGLGSSASWQKCASSARPPQTGRDSSRHHRGHAPVDRGSASADRGDRRSTRPGPPRPALSKTLLSAPSAFARHLASASLYIASSLDISPRRLAARANLRQIAVSNVHSAWGVGLGIRNARGTETHRSAQATILRRPGRAASFATLMVNVIAGTRAGRAARTEATHAARGHASHGGEVMGSAVMGSGHGRQPGEPCKSALSTESKGPSHPKRKNAWGRFLDNVETCLERPRQVGRCLTE
jgi:hypothetical protein